jgi:hypothetical protein
MSRNLIVGAVWNKCLGGNKRWPPIVLGIRGSATNWMTCHQKHNRRCVYMTVWLVSCSVFL